ncbi:MAG: hypothetical protein K9N11_08795 [Lentisphaeria bacterium]|nr:hypothetical protein [Candidatus Neomarinimicrobiota bacterium]MCF7842934.1 hypothetical protein [Lentisphaeria bacterium]
MSRVIQDWKKAVTLPWFLVGLVVYAGTVAALIYWLILPLQKHYTTLIDGQDDLENTYINLIQLDIETAIDSIDQHVAHLNQLKDNFEKRLLREPNLNALMPVLDNSATRAKLAVSTLEPLNKRQNLAGGPYQKLYARVSLSGTYANFLKWLKILDEYEVWFLIEKLNIEPTKTADIHTFTVELGVLRSTKTGAA